tara:strand:- start:283 stop:477 length:195 start_codon:yes stop_codon:yes gene_type:complete
MMRHGHHSGVLLAPVLSSLTDTLIHQYRLIAARYFYFDEDDNHDICCCKDKEAAGTGVNNSSST